MIPGWGRSPGEGHGNSLQYSCLENSIDRGAWRATVHRVKEWDMTEQLTLSLSRLITQILQTYTKLFEQLMFQTWKSTHIQIQTYILLDETRYKNIITHFSKKK